MKLSSRTTLLILATAQVAFVVVLAGVLAYLAQVSTDATRANRQLAQVNQEAIRRDCLDKEELKDVMRTIMDAVIRFNAASSDPMLRERAKTYRALIGGLQPVSCQGVST